MNIKVLKLTLISIIVLTVIPVCAEDLENERSFWFGFQTGVNTSFFNTPITEYGDPDSDFESFVRISALFGVKSELKLSNKIALNAELYITGRGGSYRAENKSVIVMGTSSNDKAYHMRNFNLTYLEMPILINFNLNQLFPPVNSYNSSSPTHNYFSFTAGLAPSLNVGSTLRVNSFTEGETISGSLVEVNSHYETEEFDYAESFIFNSIIGFAYNIPTKDNGIASFNLRWTQSLNDVYNVDLKDDYNMQTKMSTITLGASILF